MVENMLYTSQHIPISLQQLLPHPKLNVIAFTAHKFPPLRRTQLNQPDFKDIACFYSTLPPTEHTFDLEAVRHFLIPPLNVVQALCELASASDASLNSIIFTSPTHIEASLRYPLQLAFYWKEVIKQREIQQSWNQAVKAIDAEISSNTSENTTFHQSKSILARLPWSGNLGQLQMHQLSAFFTTEWLTESHENALLDILRLELMLSKSSDVGSVVVVDASFMLLLKKAFIWDLEGYSNGTDYKWISERGKQLAKGEKRYLATIANESNQHWTALVIDFADGKILHGDSFRNPMLSGLTQVLDWWTSFHTGRTFTHQDLPTTKQTDSFSCGVLAWHTLCNYFLPSKADEFAVNTAMLARAQIFLQLVRYVGDIDPVVMLDVVPKSESGLTPVVAPAAVNGEKDSNIHVESEEVITPNGGTTRMDRDIDPDSGTEPEHWSDDSAEALSITPSPINQSAHANVTRPTTKSTIRVALEKKGSPVGLLRFFSKASDADKQKDIHHGMEYIKEQAEKIAMDKTHDLMIQAAERKKIARERKQRYREQKKNKEIITGLRLPDGRKRPTKVVHLQEPPKLDQGGTVAKLSRPARFLNKKWKEHHRKAMGRPRIHVNKDPEPLYTNWFEPFLFDDIEIARINAGGPTWSTTAMMHELHKKNYKKYKKLNRTTIDGWIDRTGEVPRWTENALKRIKRGVNLANENAGRRGVLRKYPEIVKSIKERIHAIRSAGAVVTVVTARGILLAIIKKLAPKILTKKFGDGSTFKASDSFMRQWLSETMGYSRRRGTQAANKLPIDWEDKCERSFLRKAYIIKEEDIPSQLFVNSDQTQVVYAPGDKVTWAPTGDKQVPINGTDEKRAFTVLVSVSCDGTALPIQAIYLGKTDHCRPSPTAPHRNDLLSAGCLLQQSGTTTYWSNHQTMQDFVNRILAPYFEEQKRKLGLPIQQKSLWSIDVWSVHRSLSFRTWMKSNHPNIIIDYIPGGCTGVAQPCDVGIQRPFKHAIKRAYHEDIVSEISLQLDQQEEIITLDTRLPRLRDCSARWLWEGYKAIQNEALVKKAFQQCQVRSWNLSYEVLTGVDARAHLRTLKTVDPVFWAELTQENGAVHEPPPDNVPQPEDEQNEEIGYMDDSDVPVSIVAKSIIHNDSCKVGYVYHAEGGLMNKHEAEGFTDDGITTRKRKVHADEDQLGRGKRVKLASKRYASTHFEQH